MLPSMNRPPLWRIFTLEDSQKCADLFKQHREEIDGVLVTYLTLAKRAPLPMRCAGPILTFPCWFMLSQTTSPA